MTPYSFVLNTMQPIAHSSFLRLNNEPSAKKKQKTKLLIDYLAALSSL